MDHAEQESASVGVDREQSTAKPAWLSLLFNSAPHMKMELPAPVYGHGFGPPLDLSRPSALDAGAIAFVRQTTPPFTPVAVESETTDGLKIKRESSIKDEPAASSPGSHEAPAAAAAPANVSDQHTPADDSDGCSRTTARFSETWLAKWHQRKELLANKQQTEPPPQDQRVQVISPDVTSPHETSKRKALIRPQRKQAPESSDSIPVGIAVARQRAEKPLKQDEPANVCPSVPSDLFQAPGNTPMPPYNPFSYPAANWPMWPVPEYAGHAFWPGHAASDAMGYPNYSPPGVIHHHHVASPGAGGTPTQPPLFLIPCLDPYRQTAMLWGYHHGPWTSDLVHHPTPAPTPWPVVPHHRPFEALIHPELSVAGFVNHKADDVKPIETCLSAVEASGEPPLDEIKREQVTPEVDDKQSAEWRENAAQTIRVRDNLIEQSENKTMDADYSGLQLLSDSIERFVSRSPPSERRASTDVASGNALDVLCAAALLNEPADPAPPTPTSPPRSSQSISACTESQKELDFRLQLAEVQRIYKEKQLILKHLKPKRKEKSEKKKKKSDGKKKSKRRTDSSGSGTAEENQHGQQNESDGSSVRDGQNKCAHSDLIIPGRLELASSTRRPPGEEDAVVPKIPTSYAAALASAAGTVTSLGHASGAPEKKKRKPECPVRKHDTEPTETIVPCKKRKLIHLLRQWPDSPIASEDLEDASAKKSRSASKRHQKPKIKPKLKAEVQVKRRERASDDSAGEGDDELDNETGQPNDIDHSERLERHCLPALQLLQLHDDEDEPADSRPVEPVETVPEKSPVDEPTKPAITQEIEATNERNAIASNGEAWTLTQEALRDGLRVLIAEGGLLLAGTVTGICPPDIYGVAVDGERGCRPRILSTEELLRQAVMERRPAGLHELAVGTRVCAYWSRKSRTLYPGVVSNVYPAPPSTGHHRSQASKEDEIDVEFDDGDSGRMPISLIRLLPPDYPVTERDPNPLMTLDSRRTKRRTSEPTPLTPTTSCVMPFVKQSNGEVKMKDGKKTNKKTKRDESKENDESKSEEKKSRKRKKRHHAKVSETLADDQLIIPVSPGLAIAADDDRALSASIVAGDAEVDTLRTKANQEQPVKSKMAAFLPERQLWEWLGPSFKKASKGKGRKEFYKAIHRGDEIIRVGDCAIFLSAGRQDRPYVGRIELLWQSWGGSMTVKVRWFYHPEETCGGHRLANLKTPGALFESNHIDENDVQTISHCCTVCSIDEYRTLCRGKRDVNLNVDADATAGVGYDHFYLAGFYDPTSGHLSFEPGVLESPNQQH